MQGQVLPNNQRNQKKQDAIIIAEFEEQEKEKPGRVRLAWFWAEYSSPTGERPIYALKNPAGYDSAIP